MLNSVWPKTMYIADLGQSATFWEAPLRANVSFIDAINGK